MSHESSKISFGNSEWNLFISFLLKSECSNSRFMYSFQFPETLIQCSDSICFVVIVFKVLGFFLFALTFRYIIHHLFAKRYMKLLHESKAKIRTGNHQKAVRNINILSFPKNCCFHNTCIPMPIGKLASTID